MSHSPYPSDRIQKASALLAPYAVPIVSPRGQIHTEEEDAFRFPFQRDRDRIVHAQAFRRLKGKTQVYAPSDSDHHRTRLTHTIEVAYISRNIARTLSLNEDLAECIALAHDLGHTPFGHAGEAAMNRCLAPYGEHFEHNEHSRRIVEVLERHSRLFPGLNLHYEVLEGLQKHTKLSGHSLEAQIVNLADEIAYTAHDTDDGLRSGLLETSIIATTSLGARALEQSAKKGTSLRGAIVRFLVEDLFLATQAAISKHVGLTYTSLLTFQEVLAGFTTSTRQELDEYRSMLFRYCYDHPQVREATTRGESIIESLFQHYLLAPPSSVRDYQEATGSSLPLAVKDFIAGMTDSFAERSLETLRTV